MDSIEQDKPDVQGTVKSTVLSNFSTLRISYFFLAVVFAGVLSCGYYFLSSHKFNIRTSESTTTILGIVTAFVSTYSEQRTANNTLHLPVPATFRALSFKLFDEKWLTDHSSGMHITMVGIRGLSIKTEPVDTQIANAIGHMTFETNPNIWSGYIGSAGNEILRTIKPVLASKQSCVDCHNRIQKGITSWNLGEVMGAYVIDVPASIFFAELRREAAVLGASAFLFVWGSVAFFMRQQTHITSVRAEILRESERGEMLSAARKQAENEASKLSVQVRRANEDLRLALKKEKELNALQSQFVSMASHEFRTPLAIIDGTAQRLERRCEKSDAREITKRAHKIRGAVERMTQLMESTLTAASLDVGKLSINIEPCNFTDVITGVCQRQTELLDFHKISCNISELPETIQADSGSLEQIMTNLLSNAVKYAPSAPDIEVSAYVEEHDVVFSVRDYGLGIDEDDLPRMFERFFRARTSTGIAGTGIGLNLIKILIELHGGSIAIASKVGEGSTFTVHLPISGPKEILKDGCQAA